MPPKKKPKPKARVKRKPPAAKKRKTSKNILGTSGKAKFFSQIRTVDETGKTIGERITPGVKTSFPSPIPKLRRRGPLPKPRRKGQKMGAIVRFERRTERKKRSK